MFIDLQEHNKLGKLCHSVPSAYRNYMSSGRFGAKQNFN